MTRTISIILVIMAISSNVYYNIYEALRPAQKVVSDAMDTCPAHWRLSLRDLDFFTFFNLKLCSANDLHNVALHSFENLELLT